MHAAGSLLIRVSVSANTHTSPPRARTSCRSLFSFSSSTSLGAMVTTGMAAVAGPAGQQAMLQFTGQVGLGVDAADLLELERAFQRDGVVQAAPQEQRVFIAGEFSGPGDDLRLQRHQVARVGHAVAVAVFAGDLHAAGNAGDAEDRKCKRHFSCARSCRQGT